MKKAEFVALGISEELAAKAEKASLEESAPFTVPTLQWKNVSETI